MRGIIRLLFRWVRKRNEGLGRNVRLLLLASFFLEESTLGMVKEGDTCRETDELE